MPRDRPSKRGRPSKVTAELIAKLEKDVLEGHVIEVVCAAAGIDRRTYSNWMRQGEDDDADGKNSLFADFFHTLKRAEAEAEKLVLRMLLAADKSVPWQRYAWLLERRWPQRWAKQPDVIVQQPDVPKAVREAPTAKLLQLVAQRKAC